jgi:tRNA-dihydrouridine synthase
VNNFWLELKKSLGRELRVLAPMEEVTDTVFRRVLLELGRPDVMFTEFTSVEGLQSRGRHAVSHRLLFDKKEKPLVAQIWGISPEHYRESARQIVEMGFDGVDINMGCPVKKIIAKGACSALIKNPQLAVEIIQAVREGVDGKIPVSVKTRIGFGEINTVEWITNILEHGRPDALTLHGRTVKQESKPPVHWDQIEIARKLRDDILPACLIIANGDLHTIQDIRDKCNLYGLDGGMVGRGIFHNPWLFNEDINYENITVNMRLDALLLHLKLFDSTWGDKTHEDNTGSAWSAKNFVSLKRFFKIYIQGFDNAVDLRVKLMESKNVVEAMSMINEYKNNLSIQ